MDPGTTPALANAALPPVLPAAVLDLLTRAHIPAALHANYGEALAKEGFASAEMFTVLDEDSLTHCGITVKAHVKMILKAIAEDELGPKAAPVAKAVQVAATVAAPVAVTNTALAAFAVPSIDILEYKTVEQRLVDFYATHKVRKRTAEMRSLAQQALANGLEATNAILKQTYGADLDPVEVKETYQAIRTYFADNNPTLPTEQVELIAWQAACDFASIDKQLYTTYGVPLTPPTNMTSGAPLQLMMYRRQPQIIVMQQEKKDTSCIEDLLKCLVCIELCRCCCC
jgi:hypothetical protein